MFPRPSRVSLLAALLSLAAPARAQCPCPASGVEVIGHRGMGVDGDDNPFPENTLASFAAAVDAGATMVELDVQLSSDGALVVMHDDAVDRTTDGTGCVGDLDLATLRGLHAGTETIPTLAEVFAAVTVGVNVEIKVDDGGGCPATDRDATAAELVRVLGESAGTRPIVVSSFDLEQLLAVRAIAPEVRLAFLFTGLDGFGAALEHGMDAHPLVVSARAREVAAHRAAGLAVRPWTVDDAATMSRLLGMGVDGIITDEASLLATTAGAFCDTYVCPEPDAGAGDGGATDAGDAGPPPRAGGSGCAAVPPSPGGRSPLPVALVALGMGALLPRRRR